MKSILSNTMQRYDVFFVLCNSLHEFFRNSYAKIDFNQVISRF